MRKQKPDYIRKRTEDREQSTESKKHILFAFILIWLALLPGVCLGAEYYVDAAGGNDTNPGTSELPWATLGRAYTWYDGEPKVQEGDTVIFRNGNYGSFLDTSRIPADNEPFYRTDWITYKAEAGHAPTLADVEIYNADLWGETLIDGSSYIILDGFEVLNGLKIERTSYVQIRNCDISAEPLPSPYDQGLYAPYYLKTTLAGRDSDYVTIENNEIHHAYRGIDEEGEGSNWIIRGNRIHRLADDGIEASRHNHQIIEDNYIYDIDKRRTQIFIWGNQTGEFIEGETVIQAGTEAEGIVYSITPSGDAVITVLQTNDKFFNEETDGGGPITGQTSGATIENVDKDYSHTDAIQVDGGSITDIIIRGNTIIREGDGGGQAIKLETRGNPIENVVFENNLVWAPKPIIGGDGGYVEIIDFNNNTFCALGDWGEDSGIVNSVLTISNMYNNIFGCNISFSAVSNHGNNIFRYEPTYFTRDPATEEVYYSVEELFVNSAGGDFHLAEDSLARDFGDPLYAPAEDIEGNPRDAKPDAGCYEYIALSFIYGDVNGNGEVTSYDAALVARYAVGLETFTDEQRQKADVSGNGEVSAYDAALIAQRAVGLIDRFPVEE